MSESVHLKRISQSVRGRLAVNATSLLKLDGVDLEIREDALRAVAKKAMKRKTGARGLRSILENALLETMYELPSKEGVHKVSVDASTITEGARPLYIYEESEKSA